MNLKASGVPDSHFKKEQLQKGLIVEREHSNSLSVRKAIAKAHLLENPNYYNNPMFRSDLKNKTKAAVVHRKKKTASSFGSWIKKLDELGKRM